MRLSDRARRPRAIALLLGLAAFARPERTRAQAAEPIELAWEAPPECPTADGVRARIRRLSGSTPPATESAQLRAEAIVTRKPGGGLQLQLVIHAGHLTGTRKIEGRSCADLAGATAVALVLLLRSSEPLSEQELAGPSAGSGGESAASTGEESTNDAKQGPPPTPAPPSLREPRASASTERRWHALLQAPLFAAGLGYFESVSLGAGFAGGAMFGDWRFVAEGHAWLRHHATTTQNSEEYGADIDRLGASLRACRTLFRSRIELAPCASLTLEHLSARGTGPQIVSQNDAALSVAGGIGGQARLQVAPWLTLMAGADLQLAMSRPDIVLGGVGRIEQVGPVAVSVIAGSEWIL